MTNLDLMKEEAPKFEELICKLREIQVKFQRNLLILHQTIETLEAKPELLNSIELFEKDAEFRASNLEAEVMQLREQLAIIKEILGLNARKSPVEY